jgi:hypothetical protein
MKNCGGYLEEKLSDSATPGGAGEREKRAPGRIAQDRLQLGNPRWSRKFRTNAQSYPKWRKKAVADNHFWVP